MKLTKEMVTLAYCASIIIVGKVMLLMIPNIEVVTFLLIIYTLVLGFKRAFIVALIYTIVEIFLWTLSTQVYIWLLIVVVTALFKPIIKDRFLFWAMFSGFFGLAFGFLSSIPYIVIVDIHYAITYFFSGILFDIPHMLGNYFFMFLLGRIIYDLLNKLINNNQLQDIGG